MAKLNEFTVEGNYPFPADMLRYDACWPKGSADAQEMVESLLRNDPQRTRKVTLYSNAPVVTAGRWESFGWRVVHAAGRGRTR